MDQSPPSPWFLFVGYMDPHDPYFAHPYDGSGYARAGELPLLLLVLLGLVCCRTPLSRWDGERDLAAADSARRTDPPAGEH